MVVSRDLFIDLPKPDPTGKTKTQIEDIKNFYKKQDEMWPGSKFDFVQVECGYKHTLLLNKKGNVYSFGEGLKG